jgi:hypothetical protein
VPVHDACTAAAVLVCPLGEDAVHLQRTHLYIGHVLAGMWHGPYWTQICWLAHVVAIQDAYANGHVPGTCPRPPRAQLPFLTAARRWWGGGGDGHVLHAQHAYQGMVQSAVQGCRLCHKSVPCAGRGPGSWQLSLTVIHSIAMLLPTIS